MADFIAMILNHEILKALFPYVIIIMLGVIISRLGKLVLKLDMITKTVSNQEINTESNQKDKTENDITYF